MWAIALKEMLLVKDTAAIRLLREVRYSKYSIDPGIKDLAAFVVTSMAARSFSISAAASSLFLERLAFQAVKARRLKDSPNEGIMYVGVR